MILISFTYEVEVCKSLAEDSLCRITSDFKVIVSFSLLVIPYFEIYFPLPEHLGCKCQSLSNLFAQYVLLIIFDTVSGYADHRII